MVYRFGHFVLNPTLRVLYRDGEPVHITAKSFETLLVLIRRRGQVMNKDELMAALWPDTVVEEANLAQSVSTLRKALGDNPAEHRYIATIPGRGYSFVATVMEDSDRAVRSNLTQTQSLKAKLLRYPWIFASAGALLLAGVVWVLWRGHGDP